jgi:hypothetical protein
MTSLEVTWEDLKDFIAQKDAAYDYVEFDHSYLVLSEAAGFSLFCRISRLHSSADLTDFEATYK